MPKSTASRVVLTLLALLPLAGCSEKPANRAPKIGFMPKLIGIPYFNACEKGAREAAKELGVELVYTGPTSADSAKQIELLENWVAAGELDVLCVACNDPEQVARPLRKAQKGKKKIPVVTYDADSQPDARTFFVNQATYGSVARMMVDVLAGQIGKQGKVGILTSAVDAPNQHEWFKRIEAYVKEKYPQIELLPQVEHGEDRDLGITKAKALIEANPDLKGIIGLTSVAVPAAAEAVRQENKKGQIKVTGVSTPRDMRDYVLDDTVTEFVLWNPVDLGYLTVHVAELVRKNKMPEDGTIKAGRLGEIKVRGREVLLGEPILFTKENIDKFDF